MTLRRWQREAIAATINHIENGCGPGVVTAVMGSGKTRVLVAVAKWLTEQGWRVVVSAPRLLIVDQIRKALSQADLQDVVVTTNASLHKHLDADTFWIADECHRTEAPKQVLDVVMRNGKLAIGGALGFSATPYLADAYRGLRIYDSEIYRYSPEDAIIDGTIVPPRIVYSEGVITRHEAQVAEQEIDETILDRFDGLDDWENAEVGSTGLLTLHYKAPQTADTATAVSVSIARIVSVVRNELGDVRYGVINASSIEDAELATDALNAIDVTAHAIHSGIDKSAIQAILRAHEQGKLHVVVHVNMLAEGVDMPWIRWLGIRRALRSRVRFAQEIGRALRAYPGKHEALIVDASGSTATLSILDDIEAQLGFAKQPAKRVSELGDKEADRLYRVFLGSALVVSTLDLTFVSAYQDGLKALSRSIRNGTTANVKAAISQAKYITQQSLQRTVEPIAQERLFHRLRAFMHASTFASDTRLQDITQALVNGWLNQYAELLSIGGSAALIGAWTIVADESLPDVVRAEVGLSPWFATFESDEFIAALTQELSDSGGAVFLAVMTRKVGNAYQWIAVKKTRHGKARGTDGHANSFVDCYVDAAAWAKKNDRKNVDLVDAFVVSKPQLREKVASQAGLRVVRPSGALGDDLRRLLFARASKLGWRKR